MVTLTAMARRGDGPPVTTTRSSTCPNPSTNVREAPPWGGPGTTLLPSTVTALTAVARTGSRTSSVPAGCVSVKPHVAVDGAAPSSPARADACEDDEDALNAIVKNGVANRAEGHDVGNCGANTTVLFG